MPGKENVALIEVRIAGFTTMGTSIGDEEKSGTDDPKKGGVKDIVINSPRVNLYGDHKLPNGKTLDGMFAANKYVIPASAQADSVVRNNGEIRPGVPKITHTVDYDDVPGSAHQLANKIRTD